MKIKPVEVTPIPKYPDKYSADMQRVLISARPKRWLGRSLTAGMLSTVVMLSLSGCYTTDGVPVQSPTVPVVSPGGPDHITLGEPLPFPALSYGLPIPLFEYGEGTGAIGCVSVAAPVFMSEEDAFAILSAALAEAGLTLSRDAELLENINLPVTSLYPGINMKESKDRYETVKGTLIPDGLLKEHGMPMAFVSTNDVRDWEKQNENMASVSEFNVKKTAQTLAENNHGLVVFYDPIVGMDYDKLWSLKQEDGESDESYYARRRALEQEETMRIRTESEHLLRQQAEAFIKWLGNEVQS